MIDHQDTPQFQAARARMVERELKGRQITDPRVLDAMARTPRHLFVPQRARHKAYNDHPLLIGHDQTISQPYIVALMTQLAEPQAHERALDVGTGSGYQAAILSPLVKEVYSIEIVELLAVRAKARLTELGYANVTTRHGDGYAGWPDRAPFDVIIVAAAPRQIPPALIKQLAPGGRLVIPVGDQQRQTLTVIRKDMAGQVTRTEVIDVLFVPMTGGL